MEIKNFKDPNVNEQKANINLNKIKRKNKKLKEQNHSLKKKNRGLKKENHDLKQKNRSLTLKLDEYKKNAIQKQYKTFEVINNDKDDVPRDENGFIILKRKV